MARPPVSRRRDRPVRRIVEDEEHASSIDPADIILGVVLLLVIPMATYLLLWAVGLPVGGETGVTWEEQLELKDELQNLEVPLQESELRMRLNRVDSLLQVRVAEYMRHSRQQSDPVIKDRFQKCARSVLGTCEAELQILREAIPRSSALHESPAYLQQISRRLDHIAMIRSDLNKEKVFFSND